MSEADAILRAARIQGAGAAAIVKALGMLAHNIVQASERQIEPVSMKDFDALVVESGIDWNSLVELTTP